MTVAARADVWLRRKGGRPDSWYYRKLRLLTRNEGEARSRAQLARDGRWPPAEHRAARAAAAAFRPPPPPAPELQPAPVGAGPPPPPVDWTGAAAAAGAEGAAFTPGADEAAADEAPEPQQISNEQLSLLVVALQSKALELYTRRKVFPGFVAPALAPELVSDLSTAYKAMFDYGGASLLLPPWVNGLVVPGISIAMTTAAMVQAFRDQALQQQAAAAAAEKADG